MLDQKEGPVCRWCGQEEESGNHVALICPAGEELGRRWSCWEQMDDKEKARRSSGLTSQKLSFLSPSSLPSR